MGLDVDGPPVEVHGHPPGSGWNGHYRQRLYHALVAGCAETGDLLEGELHPGASHLGKWALKLTLGVGGPDSGTAVSYGDGAPGCGILGTPVAGGSEVAKCALHRTNPQ